MNRLLDIKPTCQKVLSNLPSKIFRQIVIKLFALMHDPRPQDSQKLQGYPYYRIDSGEYRIVYLIDSEKVTILVIGKRNDDEVYKKLERL